MKVIIFGATGTVGRLMVDQALADGHQVTAFARRPEKLDAAHPLLTRVAGDVLDPKSVANAILGHDAVVVALGAGRKGTVRSAGTRNVIDGMQKHSVQRLICQSTLGAGDSAQTLNFFWKHIMFGLLLKEAMADHELQERYVRESGLDWTIVRPAAFTDGNLTGAYRHGFAPTEKGLTLKISRADVADFVLKQLGDPSYMRKTPGLSY